jgi:hypothetical protein
LLLGTVGLLIGARRFLSPHSPIASGTDVDTETSSEWPR